MTRLLDALAAVRGTVLRWLGYPSPTYELGRGWKKAQRENRSVS